MRRRAAFTCCGRRRSPGFIRKARWWPENWCARAGLWARTEPVPASAAGQSSGSTRTGCTTPRKRICASRSGAIIASRPGPTSWNCTGAVDCQVYVTPVSREEVCVALISSSPKLRLRLKTGSENFRNSAHASKMRNSLPANEARSRSPEDCGACIVAEPCW